MAEYVKSVVVNSALPSPSGQAPIITTGQIVLEAIEPDALGLGGLPDGLMGSGWEEPNDPPELACPVLKKLSDVRARALATLRSRSLFRPVRTKRQPGVHC